MVFLIFLKFFFEQIRHYQREILRLEAENEKLRSTNASLMQQKDLKVDTTPKPAASDSDCSTCSSCSSSSSSEDEDSDTEKTEPATAAAPPPADKAEAPQEEAKGNSEGDKETDTGYESSNSGSNKALKGEATSTCNNVWHNKKRHSFLYIAIVVFHVFHTDHSGEANSRLYTIVKSLTHISFCTVRKDALL